MALKRPDKLRARLTGEASHFDFYFDGATASAFAPATKVYSVEKAPPTIDTMLPALEQETGIRFASAPLLFSDPHSVLTRGLISAVVVGPAVVAGASCEHFAFRSPGVNWEIWIASGQRALPRRLAVTFTDRTNFPRVLVEFLNWNLHPWLKAGYKRNIARVQVQAKSQFHGGRGSSAMGIPATLRASLCQRSTGWLGALPYIFARGTRRKQFSPILTPDV